MDLFWIEIVCVVLLFLCPIIASILNQRYDGSPKAQEAHFRSLNYAKQVLASDETILLSDYSRGLLAHVILSDKCVYFIREKRNGEFLLRTAFKTSYNDIYKCKYYNFYMEKAKPEKGVTNIKIITRYNGSCLLGGFPKANEIAHELVRRGY